MSRKLKCSSQPSWISSFSAPAALAGWCRFCWGMRSWLQMWRSQVCAIITNEKGDGPSGQVK